MRSSGFLLIALFLGVSLNSFSQEKIDLLILNKNYEEALQQIDKEIQKQQESSLWLKKGLILNALQNYQEAQKAFLSGLEIDPDNSELNSEMAECLTQLGNYQDAISYFRKSVELQPDNLIIKGKLGRALINLQDYKTAYKIFTEIYSIDSTNVYWNKQLAYSAFQTKRKKQAISLYEKVLEQNPRDYKTYFNLARLYSNNDGAKALELIQTGLKQFPDNADFQLELANYFFGTKQYELAVQKFENYFSAGGDTVYKVRLNYAISIYLSGDEEKALNAILPCYRANPNDAFVLFYMSLCNKKMANYEKAESFMEGAIDMSYPDWLPEMYHHLGQIYGQQRKFPESIDALKEAYDLNPTNFEILFEIATTYEEFNSNKTLALNYYRIYLKEAGEAGKNINYALDRIERIKEDMFFEE